MQYIVIELEPEARIATKDGEPILFSNKADAFRYASTCHKGLVYPIIDVMKIFDRIKVLASGQYNGEDILDELTALVNEVV